MTPEVPPPPSGEPAGGQEPAGRSVGWQLLQIGVLAALLLAGMYVVDLDAKALAEKRARTALLLAVNAVAEGVPTASAGSELEQASERYAKVCAECATVWRCEETIRAIRTEKKNPAGRGPCKEGVFERGTSGETARSPRAQ